MSDSNKLPEILSPCGSIEAVEAAVRCGCDAVYVGSKAFSARQNAKNFSADELADAVKLCHKNGVKVYQAINTLVTDSELCKVASELKIACEVGVDGIIIQDLAVAELAKMLCPDMPVHASTQMSVHTVSGVEMCRRLGFVRVVAARELSLDTLTKLCDTGVEIETFVHGALCMSVSGQCYMSALIGSRSANRGLCAQSCRLPFSAVSGKDSCDLSLKDMSHIDDIKRLTDAGVASLKIEGRMKRPEYVAAATFSCRQSLANLPYDKMLLQEVFSRGGFTNGYLEGKTGRDMFGTRTREDAVASQEALPKIHELYRQPFKRFAVDMVLKVHSGENVSLSVSDKGKNGLSVTVTGGLPQVAQSRELTCEYAQKQLSKLGGSAYTADNIYCDIQSGLTVSASELNSLRRNAVSALDDMQTNSFKKHACAEYQGAEHNRRRQRNQTLRAYFTYANQLSTLSKDDLNSLELISLPIAEAEKLDCIPNKLSVYLPRFDFDEQRTRQRIKKLAENGLKHITATNIAHFALADMGLDIHADFGLNVTNSLTASKLVQLGASDITASFELTAKQLEYLDCERPLGIIAYGKLPAMLTVNCPIKQAVNSCKSCTGCLTDRTKRRFDVKCSGTYVEILNSETLWLADKLNYFSAMDFLTLMFYKETPQQIRSIINSYKHGSLSASDKITRGLYFRGLAEHK